LSLCPWQTGQSLEVTTRSTSFKKRFFSKLSFSRKDLLKRWINPSYFAVLGQFSGGFLSFFGFVYKKMSISSSVLSLSFLSLSNNPVYKYRLSRQLSGRKDGNFIASSFSDLSKSRSSFKSISSTYPRPWHASHMPFGLLNENTLE